MAIIYADIFFPAALPFFKKLNLDVVVVVVVIV